MDDQPANTVSRDVAAQVGTLVHNVLANVDFRSPGEVETLVERHAERLVIESSTLRGEACQLTSQLLQSPLAKTLGSARELLAEVEFLLKWPPRDTTNGQRMIRGYIDCLYQDEQRRWHLVDYKTNRTTAADVPQVAEQYAMQMGVYALAVEQALGTPPVSLTLYFLRPEVAYPVAWDDDVRKHTIELVSAAIARETRPLDAALH